MSWTCPKCDRDLPWKDFRHYCQRVDLKFYSKVVHKDKPVIRSVASGKKFENHIRLTSLDELRPGVFVYLRESYELK